MLHTFKRQLPWGSPSGFREKIQGTEYVPGSKITTFRAGYRRRPGMKIHFWDLNPRNKHLNPEPFNPMVATYAKWWWTDFKEDVAGHHIARHFDMQDHKRSVPRISAIEEFSIIASDSMQPAGDYFYLKIGRLDPIECILFNEEEERPQHVTNLNGNLPDPLLEIVAIRDGFKTTVEFIRYWRAELQRLKTDSMEGQITHWTEPAMSCYDLERADIYEPKNARS